MTAGLYVLEQVTQLSEIRTSDAINIATKSIETGASGEVVASIVRIHLLNTILHDLGMDGQESYSLSVSEK